jgi:hypothetical protein
MCRIGLMPGENQLREFALKSHCVHRCPATRDWRARYRQFEPNQSAKLS